MRLALFLAMLLLTSAMAPRLASAQAILQLEALDADLYTVLLSRVQAGDSTVNYQQMRLAFALTPEYEPYDIEPKEQKRRMFDLLFQDENPEAARLVADSVLAVRFVDADAHYGAGVANDMLGDTEAAAFHFSLFEGIVNSILYTAEGTQADPFVVIATDEQYTLIGVLELRTTGQELVTCNDASCDRQSLRDPNDGATLEFFFDVSVPFAQMRRDLQGE